MCAAALCLAAAYCGLWLLRGSTAGSSGADGSSTEPPSRAEWPGQRAFADGTAGRGGEAQEAQASPDMAELRRLCGWPWFGTFGPECLEALERRYGPQPAVGDESFYGEPDYRMFNPVMLGRTVTWDEVFEDAVGALARVEDALVRPECLATEGRFRFDLREACAADEVAKLGIMRRECAEMLGEFGYSNEPSPGSWREVLDASQGLEWRQRDWEKALDGVNEAVDTTEYHARRERLDNVWFGAMWRVAKCHTLPPRALNALGPFRGATGWPARRLDTGLIETAARLGSEWALSVVLNRWNRPALPANAAALAELDAERPVLAELVRMWNHASLVWHASEAERSEAHVAMIAHALAALELADALGVQVHTEAVLRRVSGRASKAQVTEALVRMPRWLTEQGWTVVVAAGEDGEERVFESPDQVRGEDPWGEWWDAGRISVWPGRGDAEGAGARAPKVPPTKRP